MAHWTENAVARLRADAIRRLTRACIAATNDLKTIVSVPAPRKVSKSGRVYAATKATPGAPPRKLTGRGRASLTYHVDKIRLEGTVGTNVIYMPVHEYGKGRSGGLHKFVEPVMAKNRTRYEKILEGG